MKIDKPTITDLTEMQHTHASAEQGGTVAAANIASGATLSKTDDTNVTLTLGGTVASALLKAVSLTLGWAGLLASSRGGTGNGFTKFSGPTTAEKTFTLPDVSATLVTTATLNGATLPVSATTVTASGQIVGGDSANIRKDGSDTDFAGSYLGVSNAANNRTWAIQLSASNHLDWWHYPGAASTRYMRLSTTGLAVTGAISATGQVAAGAAASGTASFYGYKVSGTVFVNLQSATTNGYLSNDGTNLMLASHIGTTGVKVKIALNSADDTVVISSTGLAVTGAITCSTGFGANGNAAQTKVTVNAASTDLASVVALCNQLRAALIANGIAV